MYRYNDGNCDVNGRNEVDDGDDEKGKEERDANYDDTITMIYIIQ